MGQVAGPDARRTVAEREIDGDFHFPTGNGLAPYSIVPPLDAPFWLALAGGALFALPVMPAARRWRADLVGHHPRVALPLDIGLDAVLVGLLLFSLVVLAGSSYQPYIYGNF